jgi:DNA-directed RNA polymerase subunit RPC12/RpoP
MKVKCPNCKRMSFETTEHYDPNANVRGHFVKCLLPYHIDWLCSSTTHAAEMTCPECLAPLVVKGRLLVVEDKPVVEVHVEAEVPEVFEDPAAEPAEPAKLFVCDVCGRELKTPAALSRHKTVHKNKEEAANG